MVDQILAEIRAMLTEIIGDEYALSLDITMDTSLERDLELESIEFVKLATRLTERYGDRINLVEFLATKEINEIIEMTVGDLVTYIANCLILADAIDG